MINFEVIYLIFDNSDFQWLKPRLLHENSYLIVLLGTFVKLGADIRTTI